MVMQKTRYRQVIRYLHDDTSNDVLNSSLKLLPVALFFIFLFYTASAIASVTATTGRTVLSIDETVNLQIKSDSSSDEPELSILEKDFQILGRSQSQNYSLINGNASQTHTWNVALLPKRTGEITIPAIKVGSETSQPIHLVIQKQSSTPGVDGKDVYLKIELFDDNKKALENTYYVQQQIIVTVKLFHRIRFSNATLSDLEIENTVVEKLGEDANYSKTIGNNRYNIIERRYAIYPQQSGPLTIPALTFTGNAEISQNFSLFSRPGRQVISRTKPIILTIAAIPENYTGKHWLPAESLEIESEILEDTNSITAGEAITRHIIVRAKGLLGSQLPVTTVASSRSIKTYPDKEKLSNQLVNGKVIGIRRDTIAIIPLKPGKFSLPEINITWWNTSTNQQENSRLPARTLTAQPNEEQSEQFERNKQLVQSQTQQNSAPPANETAQTIKTTPVKEIIYKEPELTKNIWFWVSIALAILWLMTLALFIVTSGKKKRPVKQQSASDRAILNQKHDKYLQQLYQACQKHDAHMTSRLLVLWAKLHFNQPMLSGLSAVIDLIDNDSLSQEIMRLESAQFSLEKESWQGDNLSSELKKYLHQETIKKKSQQEKTTQAFSPLNP